ncbi:MAG: hypothetical protein COB54_04880 [Alphaproteobacteria bacterium]|nr:MAG: hypothetical protein COB54_04880 [Alphaproteobacteria bacterium]
MIVFDLRCEENHVFEAWFRNSEAYEDQAMSDQVECPFCGSTSVSKSLMSPNIPAKSNRRPRPGPDFIKADHMVAASANVPDSMEASAEDVKRALEHMHNTMKKYRNHVKKECEYVGENFAKEARAIHDGDAETRGIYGEATLEETEELLNDGVDILPVPGLGKLDS